jgi:hypothetical protein
MIQVPSTKQTANGNHHVMLKVIQHGVTIDFFFGGS